MLKTAEREKMGENLVIRTILTGLIAAGLFFIIFLNQDTVMAYYTKGSYYAALPIITAFVFSIVHGAFASNVFLLMGISARMNPRKQTMTKQEK